MAESRALTQLVELVTDTLNKHSLTIAPAESYIGGPIFAAITDISGSPAWFERGFAVYPNKAKSQVLGVLAVLIHEHGAASELVVHAMTKDAVLDSHARVAAAITGVAGSTGGTSDEPVGMACFGWSSRLQTRVEIRHFKGNRRQVRLQAAEHTPRGLLDFLDSAEC